MVLRLSNNFDLGGAERGARALADLIAQAGRTTGDAYSNVGSMLAGAGATIWQRKIQRQMRSDLLAQRQFENQRQTSNDAFNRQNVEQDNARASLSLFTDMHAKMKDELTQAMFRGDTAAVTEIQGRMANLGTATATLLPKVGVTGQTTTGGDAPTGATRNEIVESGRHPSYLDDNGQYQKGDYPGWNPPKPDAAQPAPLNTATSILPGAKSPLEAPHEHKDGVVCDGNTCRKVESGRDPAEVEYEDAAADLEVKAQKAHESNDPKMGVDPIKRAQLTADAGAAAKRVERLGRGLAHKDAERSRVADEQRKSADEDASKLKFANSYLSERGLLPATTQEDVDENGVKSYGDTVEHPYTELGAAQARVDEAKSDMRVGEAQRKGESREAFLARRKASRDSDLAAGWRDEPWAQGKDDAWIAKNGPLLHREAVAAKAKALLAGPGGAGDLLKEARLAADAYGGALDEFKSLRASDYEEKNPSTKAAWARVERLRTESDGLRNAYNGAVGGAAKATTTGDPEVEAIMDNRQLSDDQRLEELDKLKAKRAGSR